MHLTFLEVLQTTRLLQMPVISSRYLDTTSAVAAGEDKTALKLTLQLQLGPRDAWTDALAIQLCVHILCGGKVEGRYVIETEGLDEALGLAQSDLQSVIELAAKRAWLEQVGLCLVLKAGGIYVAKMVLDLPR